MRAHFNPKSISAQILTECCDDLGIKVSEFLNYLVMEHAIDFKTRLLDKCSKTSESHFELSKPQPQPESQPERVEQLDPFGVGFVADED